MIETKPNLTWRPDRVNCFRRMLTAQMLLERDGPATLDQLRNKLNRFYGYQVGTLALCRDLATLELIGCIEERNDRYQRCLDEKFWPFGPMVNGGAE